MIIDVNNNLKCFAQTERKMSLSEMQEIIDRYIEIIEFVGNAILCDMGGIEHDKF